MTTKYPIIGMHCAACVQKITNALLRAGLGGTVTLDPPMATFDGAGPDAAAVKAAISKAGYKVADAPAKAAPAVIQSGLKTYYPLFLILGLISLAALRGAVTGADWMLHFMAGFFIIFALFKLFDLNGFKDAYAGYDLLAKKLPAYGYVYPFLELGLGFAFLFEFHLRAALWFAAFLMAFSSLGVIQAVTQKRKIQCACLGTVLKLPMSTITLVEDLGMVAMTLMILWMP